MREFRLADSMGHVDSTQHISHSNRCTYELEVITANATPATQLYRYLLVQCHLKFNRVFFFQTYAYESIYGFSVSI